MRPSAGFMVAYSGVQFRQLYADKAVQAHQPPRHPRAQAMAAIRAVTTSLHPASPTHPWWVCHLRCSKVAQRRGLPTCSRVQRSRCYCVAGSTFPVRTVAWGSTLQVPCTASRFLSAVRHHSHWRPGETCLAGSCKPGRSRPIGARHRMLGRLPCLGTSGLSVIIIQHRPEGTNTFRGAAHPAATTATRAASCHHTARPPSCSHSRAMPYCQAFTCPMTRIHSTLLSEIVPSGR